MDAIAVRETINEARAGIRAAVRIGPGRLALEGDVEAAYALLEDAALLVDRMPQRAHQAVDAAVDLLRSKESRLIAERVDALTDAIAGLSGINWN